MGKRKVAVAYDVDNLTFLAQHLGQLKYSRAEGGHAVINIDGLETAIKALTRKDRERIENYWGLTGGINHSQKLVSINRKDVAFTRQSEEAITSLRNLFRLDYMNIYDEEFRNMVYVLNRKMNKRGINISDLDAVKYLVAFRVILDNGPKMPFEDDPMAVDTDNSEDLTFDEFSVVKGAYNDFANSPDESINLKLIQDFLEMLDFCDTLTIKKSFCIEVPQKEMPAWSWNMEVQPIYSFGEIRNFKERIFQYGSWEVTTELILGNVPEEEKMQEFMKCLDTIRKDWSQIASFKTGHKQLRTPHELRTLDVYNIGGLDFTDIYEVMFLYLERNLIEPKRKRTRKRKTS